MVSYTTVIFCLITSIFALYIYHGSALWLAIYMVPTGHMSATYLLEDARAYVGIFMRITTHNILLPVTNKKGRKNVFHAVSANENASYFCLKLVRSVYVLLLVIAYTAYYCLLCLQFDDICNIGIILCCFTSFDLFSFLVVWGHLWPISRYFGLFLVIYLLF